MARPWQPGATVDWRSKSILVTGGTGSFGRRLCEVVLAERTPRRLIVFSRDEAKQDQMRGDPRLAHEAMRFFLGDVRDRDRLRLALRDVDVVVHAAALKQVPSCEYNPFEAVRTNILGTQNLVAEAVEQKTGHVIVLSTDKAVNPVNLYGATKLCAEKIAVQANTYRGAADAPRIACVRYGNVAGSRGSVIPRFVAERPSGVLHVTHPEMSRFWITLDAAVRFVLGALDRMAGGEVFVPKLPTMRVWDLARAIAPRARIEVTGIRPGEKLHETLITEEESRHARELDDSYVIHPEFPWWSPPETAGTPLPDGFAYRSDTRAWRLTVPQVRRMLADVCFGDAPAAARAPIRAVETLDALPLRKAAGAR
jgi:UDP-N-acetylglucosamine 4,6-dehydratase (inverting)